MPVLKNSINSIVSKDEIKYGLAVYEKIQSEYNGSQPLNENVVFMEMFDNYYHLREERKPFKNLSKKLRFYEKFNDYKNTIKSGGVVSIRTIIEDISAITNQCEGVFATKLYHTLYNDKPVLDSVLGKHFKIPKYNRGKTLEDKINYFISKYDKYLVKFDEYRLTDPESEAIVTMFDRVYPSSISDEKKIDLVLWADR